MLTAGEIPEQGIKTSDYLAGFKLKTPSSLKNARIINTPSGRRRSDCFFYSTSRYFFGEYDLARMEEERRNLQTFLLKNVDKFYPEHVFPYPIKTSCATKELIIEN